MSLADTAFAAADAALFATFGDPGLLRGVVPVSVVISRAVLLEGSYGHAPRRVDTAAFQPAAAARVGDALTVGAESWILDEQTDNPSGLAEFVLRVAL